MNFNPKMIKNLLISKVNSQEKLILF